MPLSRRRASVTARCSGAKTRDYAIILNHLALLYKAMGEYGKALPLFIEARALHRELLGEKHHNYPTILSNLALTYQSMEEYGKALPLLIKAHELCRTVLGMKHHETAASLNNLALFYYTTGEYGKALPLFMEARELIAHCSGRSIPTTPAAWATWVSIGTWASTTRPCRCTSRHGS